MTGQRDVRLRRVYEEPAADDGRRILVDGLWPRGLTKQAARIDEWMRAVAPSAPLRRWYQHDAAKFGEFRRRYLDELRDPERAAALVRLCEAASAGTITLLTASRRTELSQAAVLAERLRPPEAGRVLGGGASRADGADGADGELPGDPPCLARRVCQRCGGVADEDPPTTCPQCGAGMPGD